ncbi:phage integrase N-terminal SAM-like domain-containing protein [Teredinibacter sp. KSP-S5-2]|uniref:phage integrase N-terminal SAM-like domain-containing protein n=1 Tax=Teredinibacter sp. KSP-S5-2 TaxID=3034506 RepID=UPI0039774A5A
MSVAHFLRHVREVIPIKGMAYKTEKTYLTWVRQFISYTEKRHPSSVGAAEVSRYLTHLALHKIAYIFITIFFRYKNKHTNQKMKT